MLPLAPQRKGEARTFTALLWQWAHDVLEHPGSRVALQVRDPTRPGASPAPRESLGAKTVRTAAGRGRSRFGGPAALPSAWSRVPIFPAQLQKSGFPCDPPTLERAC